MKIVKQKKWMLMLAFLFVGWSAMATNYVVSGAGSPEVNGTYEESGAYNGKPKYVKSGTNYELRYNDSMGQRWEIWDAIMWDTYYYTDDAGDTPPSTGWSRNSGSNPAPSVGPAAPTLTYSTSRFVESDDNDGTIKTTITITHNNVGGATFTGNVNDVYDATKVVVSNIPTGLSSNIVLKSSTEIEFTLTGSAAAHANANDVANLTVTFQDAAFSGGSASAVYNSTKSDLAVEFVEFLNVPATYSTITAAIAAAEAYDIIQIAAGTYTEAGITVNKTLTFKGEAANTTIVQAAASYNTASDRVFYLNTNGITARFYDLTIRYGKTTDNGGGIGKNQQSSLEIYRCDISYNIGINYSGGVDMGFYGDYYGIIEDCLISNNSTNGDGGGIAIYQGPCTIKNSTIVSNTCSGPQGGGGVRASYTTDIINCTVTGNTANGSPYGGGGVVFMSAYTYNIKNSIIYGNTCATGADLYRIADFGNTTINAYNSIIGVAGASSGDAINGTSSNVSSSDPLLSALADNGGSTQTCALQAGSPAIGAGMTGDDIPTTDQRGETRSDPPCIGAYDEGITSQPMQLVFTTTAASQSIALPLYGTVNCTVDWGDGTATEAFTTTGNKPHTFATAGTYTVEISGSLTQFGQNWNAWTGVGYLAEVVSFGDIGLNSLYGAFVNADNLTSVPATLPAAITNLQDIFRSVNRTSITNLNLWDVSHVTNMSRMFFQSDFNQNISGWNVSSATDMNHMFWQSDFDQNIGSWQIGAVTNMTNMFELVTLSTANYDAILIGWAAQTVQPNVNFHGGNSKYSAGAAATARASLISDDNWTITDGGMNIVTYTWDGSSSSDWNTAANWDLNAVPTATDNVVIANAGTAPVVASGVGASCNNLTVNSSASLTIDDGGSLITNGTITNNGTIEYNKDFFLRNEWVLLSMPFADLTANTFLDMYLQQWNEPAGNWSDVTNISEPLTPVKGFSFFDTFYESGKPIGYTFTFSGTQLNTGDQSLPVTADGTGGNTGANLVGNPYPSYLDWNEVSGYGAKYTWNGSGYDQYVYVEGSGYGEGNQIVEPMEGFFILTASSGTFSLDNSMRTHTAWAKSKNKSLQNGLVLEASGSAYEDELWLVFDEQASENFELQRDAWKLLSYNDSISQLWSVSPDGKLSIDARPDCESIQLGFANNVADFYSIGLQQMEGISIATLEDTKTGTFHDLTKGAYEFAWDVNDDEMRFILHLNPVGINELAEQPVFAYLNGEQLYVRHQQDAVIQLLDLSGRLLYQQQVSEEGVHRFAPALPKGLYLIRLLSNHSSKTQKIILH